ncbi:N-6 DNA methylase [Pseudomonas helleri]|uniref:N-6 DNA methylase n=1 Tax=Pseudomonas helleri TaxID=1608996 RepID=A0A6L5HZ64_9PSED|nr:N-6 DNA methylase [Pseudomonas helleri]MQU07735.1 N-6 DNA methylase [Pseudomonas helleri]
MNDLKNQIVNLKKTIFKISNNPKKSEIQNQDLSFKTFVLIGLVSGIETLAQRYVHYGLPKNELNNYIATGETLKGFQGTQEDWNLIDQDSLADAVNLYHTIVKQSEPFEDILSLLAEDILLTKGRGVAKGQFMTPPYIAQFLAKLIYSPKDTSEPHKFCDPCVGYGALMLAHLWNQHKENPESLKNIEIIVNDIDPFMCHVTALQILANTTQNNIDVKSFQILCSNVITQYTSGETSFLLNFITPEIVFSRIDEIQTIKLVQDLMREVLVGQPTKNKSRDSEISVGAV